MESKPLVELYSDFFVWDAWSVYEPTHSIYHIYFLMAERKGHHPEDRHNIATVTLVRTFFRPRVAGAKKRPCPN